MIPIRELLSRIRWDKAFGKGRFEIGYFDQIERRIIRVSLREMSFEEGDHFSFQLQSDEGELVSIPLHRIREVYKDGALIWERKKKGP